MDISFEDEFGGRQDGGNGGGNGNPEIVEMWDNTSKWDNPMAFETYGLTGRACFARFGKPGPDGKPTVEPVLAIDPRHADPAAPETALAVAALAVDRFCPKRPTAVVVCVPEVGTIWIAIWKDAEDGARMTSVRTDGFDGTWSLVPRVLSDERCESYALAVYDGTGRFRFPTYGWEEPSAADAKAGDLFLNAMAGRGPEAIAEKRVWTFEVGGPFRGEVTVEDGNVSGWLCRGDRKVRACAAPMEENEKRAIWKAAAYAGELAWQADALAELLGPGETARVEDGVPVVRDADGEIVAE